MCMTCIFDTLFPHLFDSSSYTLNTKQNEKYIEFQKVLTLFKDLDTEGDKRSPPPPQHQHQQQGSDNNNPDHHHLRYEQILNEKSEGSESSGDGSSDTISGYHSDSDRSNGHANSSINNDGHPSIVTYPSSSSEFGIKTGSEIGVLGEKSLFLASLFHAFHDPFIFSSFCHIYSKHL